LTTFGNFPSHRPIRPNRDSQILGYRNPLLFAIKLQEFRNSSSTFSGDPRFPGLYFLGVLPKGSPPGDTFVINIPPWGPQKGSYFPRMFLYRGKNLGGAIHGLLKCPVFLKAFGHLWGNFLFLKPPRLRILKGGVKKPSGRDLRGGLIFSLHEHSVWGRKRRFMWPPMEGGLF